MRAARTILGLLLLLGPAARHASAVEAGPESAAERLKALDPAEKRQLAERLKAWKSMSEAERERIRENLESFRALPDAERKRLQGNLERWKEKAPTRQKELEARFERLRDLPASRQDRLSSRMRLLNGLPEAERNRLLALPESERREALERLFTAAEVKRLLKPLTPSERESLQGLDAEAVKAKALALIEARRQAQLLRMPASRREEIASLPARERPRAERRFLAELHLRDLMVTVILPPKERAEFLKMPGPERDVFAEAWLRDRAETLLKRLPPSVRAEVANAPEDQKVLRAVGALFQSKLGELQQELLPSQRRALRDQPPARQWERTQAFLMENHRRLLARLPSAMRQELQRLPVHQQLRRVRDHVRSELRKSKATPLQRVGIQQLPLLLQWDAVQRLKRQKGSGR